MSSIRPVVYEVARLVRRDSPGHQSVVLHEPEEQYDESLAVERSEVHPQRTSRHAIQ
jgi:hypothetical protein